MNFVCGVLVCPGHPATGSLFISFPLTWIPDLTIPEQWERKCGLSGAGVGGFAAAYTRFPRPLSAQRQRWVLSRLSVLHLERDRAFPPLLWASFLGLQPKGEHPIGRHVWPVRHQLELPVAPTPGDIAGPGAQLSPPYRWDNAQASPAWQFESSLHLEVQVVTLGSHRFRGLVLNKEKKKRWLSKCLHYSELISCVPWRDRAFIWVL